MSVLAVENSAAVVLKPTQKREMQGEDAAVFAAMLGAHSHTDAADGVGKHRQSKTVDATAQAEKVQRANEETAEEFLAFMKMSAAEKVRYLYLKKKNLSEEQLKQLPPEEQKKIEKEIADAIKEAIRKQVGPAARFGLVEGQAPEA